MADIEYKKNGQLTPFEVFLAHTDEKERSSQFIAQLLDILLSIRNTPLLFLDIGSGDGSFLERILGGMQEEVIRRVVAIEPSKDLFLVLQNRFENFKDIVEIKNETWEAFKSDSHFDVVIAAHLYHLTPDTFAEDLHKMIAYVQKNGILFFIMRDIDDVYHFKNTFIPQFDSTYKAKSIKEVQRFFKAYEFTDFDLEIEPYTLQSELLFPEDLASREMLYEFFLKRKWQDIPDEIQKRIENYIKNKNYKFQLTEVILCIKKVSKPNLM